MVVAPLAGSTGIGAVKTGTPPVLGVNPTLKDPPMAGVEVEAKGRVKVCCARVVPADTTVTSPEGLLPPMVVAPTDRVGGFPLTPVEGLPVNPVKVIIHVKPPLRSLVVVRVTAKDVPTRAVKAEGEVANSVAMVPPSAL